MLLDTGVLIASMPSVHKSGKSGPVDNGGVSRINIAAGCVTPRYNISSMSFTLCNTIKQSASALFDGFAKLQISVLVLVFNCLTIIIQHHCRRYYCCLNLKIEQHLGDTNR